MKTVTLNVCQGVGDIFWVYQKFAPYVDQINFNICQLPAGAPKVQTRAIEFLKLLPKVRKVGTRVVTDNDYHKLAHGIFALPDILAKVNNGESGSFEYACNNLLEQGIRIEAIDPLFPIEETVDIKTEPMSLAFEPGNYLTVYVSGSMGDRGAVNANQLWETRQWLEFVELFSQKYNLDLPVVLIGASYDRDVSLDLEDKLRNAGRKTQVVIDAAPANVVHILKHSVCFLCYQSGLSILADNLDVKQAMIYFPVLRNMMYSWCKQRNIDNGVFNANTFDRKPQHVVDALTLKF